MYYSCGRIGDYEYIFDSSDESCELINIKSLVDSGIEVSTQPIRGSLSPAKLKMLYGFKGVDVGLVYKICSYMVDFYGWTDFKVTLRFNLFDLSSDKVDYKGIFNMQYELKDFCVDEHVLFIIVEPRAQKMLRGKFNSVPELRTITVYMKKYVGLPVPLQMFIYIYRLAKMHDFNGINRAFSGFIYDNLMLKINDLNWETRKQMFDMDGLKWSV